MPSIKRSGVKSQEVKTGFESYDGPTPTRGMYRGRITSFGYRQFSSGATGFELRVVLDAAKGDPKDQAKFDGFMTFPRIVFGDKEMSIARESNLYAALGVKDEPQVVYESGVDLEQRGGAPVTKIGGKNPIGLFVNVDLRQARDRDDGSMEVDGIYKVKELAPTSSAPAADEDEDDESDLVDEEETEEDEESEEDDEVEAEIAARQVELEKLTLAKLKAEAKEADIDIAGMKKADIVEAILDAEYGPDEEDEESDEEEEDDEADVEAEDEEDEEEEEDDREAELADLSREELKKILKAANPKVTILKRHENADLISMIVAAEQGDKVPF